MATLVDLHVTLVIFTVRGGHLSVLLIKRTSEPFLRHWALPAGSTQPGESLDQAAHRIFDEVTGLGAEAVHSEQLRSYVHENRSGQQNASANNSVSVAYMSILPRGLDPALGSSAELFRWWATEDLLNDEQALAFDHEAIVRDAVERCRSKLEYTTVAGSFLSEPFTLGELRRVYEDIWGAKLHPSNFARKLTSSPGFLLAEREGSPGRASLYRRGPARFVMPPLLRPMNKDAGRYSGEE